MSHNSTHKCFLPGGAFDSTMFFGLRSLVRGPRGCIICSSSSDSESWLIKSLEEDALLHQLYCGIYNSLEPLVLETPEDRPCTYLYRGRQDRARGKKWKLSSLNDLLFLCSLCLHWWHTHFSFCSPHRWVLDIEGFSYCLKLYPSKMTYSDAKDMTSYMS